MKKVIYFFVLILICSLSTGCFKKKDREAYISGDYIYDLHKVDGKTYAYIFDFSEEGAQKEVLIVPKEIGGYEVKKFNYINGYGRNLKGKMESNKLKRIYFPYVVGIETYALDNCPFLERILFVDFKSGWDNSKHIIKVFEKNCNVFYNLMAANVTYYVDDEVYWFDDFTYGEQISFVPKQPEKEGHIFDGWYTEKEFINKWNFSTSVLPNFSGLDENGWDVFVGTNLYARFIKI